MICFERVSYAFGARSAVEDLSFQTPAKGIIGLLGANGAGKSTTLRLTAGLLGAQRGKISICGVPMFPGSAARQLIGYLPESSPAPPEQEVGRYLSWVGRLRGLSGSALTRACEEALEGTELGAVQGELIGTLSKGFQQRVGLARALIGTPPVLILDEPMGGLDPLQLRRARGRLLALAERHLIILSSHRLAELELLTEQLLILAKGHLVAEGESTQLVRSLGLQRVRLHGGGSPERARSLLSEEELIDFKLLETSPPMRGKDESAGVTWHAELSISESSVPRLVNLLCQASIPLYQVMPREVPLEELFQALTTERGVH